LIHITGGENHFLGAYVNDVTIDSGNANSFTDVVMGNNGGSFSDSGTNTSLLNTRDATAGIVRNKIPHSLILGESLLTASPRTGTSATDTITAADTSFIANKAGTITLTLETASGVPGRILFVRTIQAQTVVSATSNVIPLIGGSAGTAILSATAGKWAMLQSDGSSWQIMAGN
jgi:hypothetical protein